MAEKDRVRNIDGPASREKMENRRLMVPARRPPVTGNKRKQKEPLIQHDGAVMDAKHNLHNR